MEKKKCPPRAASQEEAIVAGRDKAHSAWDYCMNDALITKAKSKKTVLMV